MRSDRFIKYSPSLEKKLDSRTAALLMGELEYRFSKHPEGFYKFIQPCDHYLYKKGDSWVETLCISQKSVWRAFSLICKFYSSKSIYLEESQKDNFFDDMPYLSYFDRNKRVNYYLRNEDNVAAILSGQKPIKSYPQIYPQPYHADESKLIMQTSQNDFSEASQNDLSPIIHKEVITENLSLLVSLPIESSTKQPERERENKIVFENTKQPSLHEVSHSEIEELLDIWRKTTARDLKGSPGSSTINNLKQVYVDVFSCSMSKWRDYCISFTTCKFLMGETKDKFNLNIAWACKIDTIEKMENKFYTLGDRTNVIYLPMKPIEEKDPILLKFKLKCLERMGEQTYISWVSKLTMRLDGSTKVVCVCPTHFIASYIGTNDRLGFKTFIKQVDIDCVQVLNPDGRVIETINA